MDGWSVRGGREAARGHRVKWFLSRTWIQTHPIKIPVAVHVHVHPCPCLHAIIRIADNDDDEDDGLGRRGSVTRLEPGSHPIPRTDIPKMNSTSESATRCWSSACGRRKDWKPAKANKKDGLARQPPTCRCDDPVQSRNRVSHSSAVIPKGEYSGGWGRRPLVMALREGADRGRILALEEAHEWAVRGSRRGTRPK